MHADRETVSDAFLYSSVLRSGSEFLTTYPVEKVAIITVPTQRSPSRSEAKRFVKRKWTTIDCSDTLAYVENFAVVSLGCQSYAPLCLLT
jgi:hypothetical protein